MRSYAVNYYLGYAQNYLYQNLNEFSKSHGYVGKLLSIPVAIGDVTIEALKHPLSAIQCIAFAAINLVGMAFIENCSFNDALLNCELGLNCAIHIPIGLAFTPLKLAYQILRGVYDPTKVNSIDYCKHVLKLNKLIV